MASRYANRRLLKNNMEAYKKLFEERGVEFISQYNTALFGEIWPEEIAELTTVEHVWSTGDRFYKLAGKYYESPTYWWVIAYYNQLPTDAHVRLGEIISIPLPLETIVGFIGA